eukprot:1997940-Prymnesium_polylepis.1
MQQLNVSSCLPEYSSSKYIWLAASAADGRSDGSSAQRSAISKFRTSLRSSSGTTIWIVLPRANTSDFSVAEPPASSSGAKNP